MENQHEIFTPTINLTNARANFSYWPKMEDETKFYPKNWAIGSCLRSNNFYAWKMVYLDEGNIALLTEYNKVYGKYFPRQLIAYGIGYSHFENELIDVIAGLLGIKLDVVMWWDQVEEQLTKLGIEVIHEQFIKSTII